MCEEDDSSLGDFVADENAEAPGKAADRAMVAQQINLALKSLTPREEKVIRLRFGLDDGRPRTLEGSAATSASPVSVFARSKPRPSASCIAASA